jgi:hypothetical protein
MWWKIKESFGFYESVLGLELNCWKTIHGVGNFYTIIDDGWWETNSWNIGFKVHPANILWGLCFWQELLLVKFEWVKSKHLNNERSNLIHYYFYKNLMWASVFNRRTHKTIRLTFSSFTLVLLYYIVKFHVCNLFHEKT